MSNNNFKLNIKNKKIIPKPDPDKLKLKPKKSKDFNLKEVENMELIYETNNN